MKKVKNYYGDAITAYQKPDIDELRAKGVLDKAYRLWLNKRQELGSEDHGTCCGGKGIEICYLGPRKRNHEYTNIVTCTFVQGNTAAAESVGPALEYLKSKGIECRYNDGWMD